MSQEIIRLSGITKTFKVKKKTVTALQDVSLTVNRGDIFGIIGLSGAGKSTLVRCINFLEKPTSGEVVVKGNVLSRLTSGQLLKLRSGMGMIFQGFNLLMQRTVLKNVTFPLELSDEGKHSAEKRALDLLEQVGLGEKASSYPSQLSGGQQQRVAIARALATRPDILLCDEATSALDPDSTSGVLDILRKINQELGITIVVITHQMNVAESICNRVAVMDQGKIVEQGTAQEIFSNPRSDTARKIIQGEDERILDKYRGQNCVKIVFDSQNVHGHLISDMVLDLQIPVSILYAKTAEHAGKTRGTMILQLPEEPDQGEKMVAYLRKHNLQAEVL